MEGLTGMEILLLFIGVIIIVVIATSINRRSKNNQTKKRKRIPRDDTITENADDDFEDVLLTGLILGDMLDNDDQVESDLGGDEVEDIDVTDDFDIGGFE